MLRGRPSSSRQSSRRHHNGFAWLVLAVIAHALTHKGFKMLTLPFCLRQATVSVKSFFEKVLSTSRGQGVDPPPALTTGLDVFDRILKVRTLSSVTTFPCSSSYLAMPSLLQVPPGYASCRNLHLKVSATT